MESGFENERKVLGVRETADPIENTTPTKSSHKESDFHTTQKQDGGREQEAVVNTEPAETHSPEILAKDVKEIVEEADRKQDEHLLENYYDKDEVDDKLALKADKSTTYTKTEVDTLVNAKQDEIDSESVESGTVSSMLGLDSEGKLVRGLVPEGSVVDEELDVDSTNPVENKAIAKAIDDIKTGQTVVDKALVSKQLENVSEESGTTQTKPFNFEATATDGGTGASDTSPTAKYIELRGQTYVLNQLINHGNFDATTGWNKENSDISVSNNVLTQTRTSGNYTTLYRRCSPIQGHKYIFKVDLSSNNSRYVDISFKNSSYASDQYIKENQQLTTTLTTYQFLFTATRDDGYYFFIRTKSVADGDEIQVRNCQLIDLTQLFNGSIPTEITNGVSLPDYGLTFTGVDIFNQLFPLPYYEYNAGSLVSANATKLTTIGYNQFDGEIRKGYYSNGSYVSSNSSICGVNPIKVVPSQKYTLERNTDFIPSVDEMAIAEYDENMNFIRKTGVNTATNELTLTSNTHYCNWWIYKSDIGATVPTQEQAKISFHLTWDGTRTGYEPYEKHEYPLGAELEISPLLSAGSVYDYKKPNGVITRTVGTYTFTGNETFVDYIGDGKTLSVAISGLKKPSSNSVKANILWAIGISVPFTSINATATPQNSIAVDNDSGRLYIKTTKSSAELATALTGAVIYFEKTTSTTEQGENFAEYIEVDDFGTMEFGGTDYNGYPQGNAIFYPADYVLLVDSLNNYCDGNVNNLAKKSDLAFKELANEYIGAISTTEIVSNALYKNEIAITGELTNAKYVSALMSNGNLYPMMKTSTSLVVISEIDFETDNITVSKIYYKD